MALVRKDELVDSLKTGDEGIIYLDKTVFYGEMGGQVGDTGVISSEGLRCEVVNATHPEKDLVAHHVKVVEGSVSVGGKVNAEIDKQRRARISRNHTATHILH